MQVYRGTWLVDRSRDGRGRAGGWDIERLAILSFTITGNSLPAAAPKWFASESAEVRGSKSFQGTVMVWVAVALVPQGFVVWPATKRAAVGTS